MVWNIQGRQSDLSPFIISGAMLLALFDILGRRWFGERAMNAARSSVPLVLQPKLGALMLFCLCLWPFSISDYWENSGRNRGCEASRPAFRCVQTHAGPSGT